MVENAGLVLRLFELYWQSNILQNRLIVQFNFNKRDFACLSQKNSCSLYQQKFYCRILPKSTWQINQRIFNKNALIYLTKTFYDEIKIEALMKHTIFYFFIRSVEWFCRDNLLIFERTFFINFRREKTSQGEKDQSAQFVR